jgi:aspartokinase/homoserine dehydrogenase 1
MYVIKFGGTSVASAKNISLVRDIVERKAQQDNLIVVVSAFSGLTNKLVKLGEQAVLNNPDNPALLAAIEQAHVDACNTLIDKDNHSLVMGYISQEIQRLKEIVQGVGLVGELTPKMQDKIVSTGERLSSFIISTYFNQLFPTELLDPAQFIITDDNHGGANVNYPKTMAAIGDKPSAIAGVAVCPGFVAQSVSGELTTLGRGGSDFTAALIAAGVNADSLEIWTDVSGMMTADPRLVKNAKVIDQISYEEAMELSHFGAKVIYPPTIQPVLEKRIPIIIKNTFEPTHAGTTISDNGLGYERAVRGISSVKDIALFTLKGSGMIGVPNFSYRLFKALSEEEINIILITQASSEHTICVGIADTESKNAKKAIDREFELEIQVHKIEPVTVQKNLSIVALVGSNMKHQVGVSGKMFGTLGANGVSVIAIAQGSSERNISAVVETKDLPKAINSLHENFFLSERKRLNLFIVGVGNVGGTLIEQIRQQTEVLLEDHHLDIRLVGMANSRTMTFDAGGIDLSNWQQVLAEGDSMDLKKFITDMFDLNLRNSVFIDNTASYDIPEHYEEILKKSISVVTPNKIACSSSYTEYQNLKQTALKYRTKYLFETNVGAGLPIISTLNDLMKRGDKILEIQAVLSGSLNFIFNNFNDGVKFTDIVLQAKEEGYTEPDPRIDLSGLDVQRKLLILMRESGIPCELSDIKGVSFLPESCMEAASVEEFFEKLSQSEEEMKTLFLNAKASGAKLKYVASYKNGKASTGLQEIPADHPFYNLDGKDNIVLFYTNRYKEQPLVVKGAGAGAEVTASGIFADIIKVANT